MIELRFHHELYDGFAVDEAAKAYAELASLELVRDPNGYIVRVTANPETLAEGIDEGVLCAELMNYALGKTIERDAAGSGAAGTEPTEPATTENGEGSALPDGGGKEVQ